MAMNSHLLGDIDNAHVGRIIHDFKSLPTKQARKAVLNAILDDLTSSERRELYARPKDPLQYDIVGSLPLELVLKIAKHLAPLRVWIIQRVSKRWQAIFTSKEIYRAIHFRSYPFTLLGAEDTTLSSSVAMMRCKYGYPRTQAYYPWPKGLQCDFEEPSTAEQLISYYSGKVAWLATDQRTACVRDLTTGTVMEFITETRGVVRFVHLSGNFLFVQASGYCTAWELATHQSHQIRLPSPHILEINARHDRAAILIGRPSEESTILSWHFGTDSVRSTNVQGQPLFTCWVNDNNTENNLLLVIQAEREVALNSYKLSRQRFTIADQEITCLDTKLLAVGQIFDPDLALFFTFARFSQYICRYDTIVSQIVPLKSPELDRDIIFFSYSTKTEKLIVRFPKYKKTGVDPAWKYDKGKMPLVDGTIYVPDSFWASFSVDPILDVKRWPNTARFHSEGCDGYIYGRGMTEGTKRWVAFGDHQLYGFAHNNGIEAVSFDCRLQFPSTARVTIRP
ncbi:Hypothetical protein PENO1_025830 [Penicillium occitanis (nom. inval.)]|nr:Hypothetical protein PENO1_025830 [Penicillium occitanis (nom. inval.)]PCH08636.1 hypothetical protein PENOC_013350 [Penicillium occitanis (nom. inval.)]